MFNRVTVITLLLTVITLLLTAMSLLPTLGAAADDGTVALIAAVYAEAGMPERELVGALLALLEQEVSIQPGLNVVERRQIELALQELALSEDLGHNLATRLQLGKIVSADLILTLELLKPEKEDETLRVLVRIVESLTGAIRGESVAPIEESRLDEAAVQMARYLAIVNAEPERPPITVAVAPFESQGRFDRLRPLELGLRDMIATRLLRWSYTIAKERARREDGQEKGQASGFQVGYCYAFHIDSIWNAERADELLRRAAGSDPDGQLGAAALRLLGEISFHHDTAQISTGHQPRAVDQLLYTLQNMPNQHRDVIWSRLPATMSPILSGLGDTTKTMQTIEFVVAEAEREVSPFRYQLAMGVTALSTGLIASRDPATGPDPIPLLKRWASGEEVTLKQLASRALAQIAQNQRDYATAAKWHLTGADGLATSTSVSDLFTRDHLRVLAARCLRQAGQWREALDGLESFQPTGPQSLSAGYWNAT